MPGLPAGRQGRRLFYLSLSYLQLKFAKNSLHYYAEEVLDKIKLICNIFNTMKYAIIETGGKQYRVSEGEVLKIERMPESGEEIVFDRVLAYNDGKQLKVGTPYLENVKVEAKFLGEEKGDKVVIFKYKRRKSYDKKIGHRQIYAKVKIEKIMEVGNGS
jgi:large subunit ribosomal protein L21